MKNCQPLQPDSLIDDMLANRMKVNSQIQQQQQHLQQHHQLHQQNHSYQHQQNHHHKPDQALADNDANESNYTELGSVASSDRTDASLRRRTKQHMPKKKELQQPSPCHSDSADPQGSSSSSSNSGSSSSSTTTAAAAAVGGHYKSSDSDDSQGSSENIDRPYTNTMSIGERLRYDQHSICDMFGF